jgi:hypothetical protein
MTLHPYPAGMSSPPPRAPRLVGGLLAAGLSLGSLAGCSWSSSDNVSCSGTSCSVTLSGDGAKADVLGSTLTLSGIEDGTASLGAGGARVSCTEGQSVTAGPLHLTCSKVTTDSVTLTASLG